MYMLYIGTRTNLEVNSNDAATLLPMPVQSLILFLLAAAMLTIITPSEHDLQQRAPSLLTYQPVIYLMEYTSSRKDRGWKNIFLRFLLFQLSIERKEYSDPHYIVRLFNHANNFSIFL